MEPPKKIYLQTCGDCPKEDCPNSEFKNLEDNVTWSRERIFEGDTEYIRKDILLRSCQYYLDMKIYDAKRELIEEIMTELSLV